MTGLDRNGSLPESHGLLVTDGHSREPEYIMPSTLGLGGRGQYLGNLLAPCFFLLGALCDGCDDRASTMLMGGLLVRIRSTSGNSR